MNFKKILNLGLVVGGMSLFWNPITSHAFEYERVWTKPSVLTLGQTLEMIESSDGGVVTVGIGAKEGTNNQFYGFISKYTEEGELLWTDKVENYASSTLSSVIETGDGGYLVSGYVDSNGNAREDGLLMKYSSDGVQEWVKVWLGNGRDAFGRVMETSDGGFIAIGDSGSTDRGFSSNGDFDGIIVKFNENGEEEWIKNWGGKGDDHFNDFLELSDGGYLVVGNTNSTDLGVTLQSQYGFAAFVAKFDKDWNQESVEFIDDGFINSFGKIFKNDDGSFTLFGTSYAGMLAARYDKDGSREWLTELSKEGEERILGNTCIKLPNGHFLFWGYSSYESEVLSFVLDEDGNQVKGYEFNHDDMRLIHYAISDSDGGIIASGVTLNEDRNTTTYVLSEYSLKKDKDIQINGNVETMIADVTIPSVSPDLVINPNLPEGSVSPKFSISNDSVSPIKLELKTFEQTSNTFNDVLPSKYDSWVGLNKQQSKDIALGLIAKEGDGWQTLTTPTSYVANHNNHEIGIIKPTSTVDFSFDVKHGTSFSEAKTVQYKMVFVFDLMK